MKDLAFNLNEIALNLKSWLDFNKNERDQENLLTDDDTCIMCPPVWPTRGALKYWVETLEAAKNELTNAK